MANLTEEVVEEILTRLPVESLLRFKCVCKSWYALFTNPKFVSKHLSNQSKGKFIVHGYRPDEGNVFYSLSNFGYSGDQFYCIENLEFDSDLDSKLPGREKCRFLLIIGHYNGIVALWNFDNIILCNPATREFRILPEYRLHPHPGYISDYRYPGLRQICTGFGYDRKTDDYKVIIVVCYWEERFPLSRHPFKAQVHSLRANSTWREVNNSVADVAHCFDGRGQFFDGVYYWKAVDITDELVLLSFDLADEVFSKAPLPDICTNKGKMTDLGVFNDESIALFVYPVGIRETCIEVWVMKEFGFMESWIKQLTIGPLVGLERPLLLWNKELLLEDASGQLKSFNLATMESKNLPLNGAGPQFWAATTYKKTLISINAREDTTTR